MPAVCACNGYWVCVLGQVSSVARQITNHRATSHAFRFSHQHVDEHAVALSRVAMKCHSICRLHVINVLSLSVIGSIQR